MQCSIRGSHSSLGQIATIVDRSCGRSERQLGRGHSKIACQAGSDGGALACPYSNCGRSFTRLDALHRHTLIHTGSENKFACPGCSKAFIRKDHVNQHIRNVHKQSRYQCPADGCDRVGARGWFREYGRKDHQAEAHPGQDLVSENKIVDDQVVEVFFGAE